MPQNVQPAFFQNPGGFQSVLNITAPRVIKAAPGVLFTVVVVAAGTAGSLVFNDAATLGAASAGNLLWQVSYSSSLVGAPFKLKLPAFSGIVLSSIPTGGTVAVAFS